MPHTKLLEIAGLSHSRDPGTKSLYLYEKYDTYFDKHSFAPSTILEVGTYNGESTKVFAGAFPEAKIVALDVALRPIDFSSCPNVTYLKADQAEKGQLESIVKREFPGGIDLVVDDASHLGFLSLITFDAVFPFLRPGGVYIIEDWGTGYLDDWLDGSRFQSFRLSWDDGNLPKRIPSHDFGMVGFVKSLVDWTHEASIRNRQDDPPTRTSRLESLEFSEGVCFAKKAVS